MNSIINRQLNLNITELKWTKTFIAKEEARSLPPNMKNLYINMLQPGVRLNTLPKFLETLKVKICSPNVGINDPSVFSTSELICLKEFTNFD
jgi:hypothetical protein